MSTFGTITGNGAFNPLIQYEFILNTLQPSVVYNSIPYVAISQVFGVPGVDQGWLPLVTTGTEATNVVQLNGSAQLPAVDGSLLTNLNKTQVGLSNVQNVDQTNADNILSGTLANARLNTLVTLGGNAFNTALNLLQLDNDLNIISAIKSGLSLVLNPKTSSLTSLNLALADVYTPATITDITSPNLTININKLGTVYKLELPQSIAVNANTIFNSTTLINGTVATAPVNDIDIVNKLYVDTSIPIYTNGQGLSLNNNIFSITNVIDADIQGAESKTLILNYNSMGQLFNVMPISIAIDASQTVSGVFTDTLLSNNITKAGNVFNEAGKLLELDINAKVLIANLPTATDLTLGIIKPDNTSITVNNGILSAIYVAPTTEQFLITEPDNQTFLTTWNIDNTLIQFDDITIDQHFTLTLQLDISTIKSGIIKSFAITNNTLQIINLFSVHIEGIGQSIIYNMEQSYTSFNPLDAITGFIQWDGDVNKSVLVTWSNGNVTQITGISDITSSDNSMQWVVTGTGDITELTAEDDSIIFTNEGSGSITDLISTNSITFRII